jgi:hypothetical protein
MSAVEHDILILRPELESFLHKEGLRERMRVRETTKAPVFTRGGERRWRLIKKGSTTSATLGFFWVSLLVFALISLPFLPALELGSALTKVAREPFYPHTSSAKISGDASSAALTGDPLLLLRNVAGRNPATFSSGDVGGAARVQQSISALPDEGSVSSASGKASPDPTKPVDLTQPQQESGAPPLSEPTQKVDLTQPQQESGAPPLSEPTQKPASHSPVAAPQPGDTTDRSSSPNTLPETPSAQNDGMSSGEVLLPDGSPTNQFLPSHSRPL